MQNPLVDLITSLTIGLLPVLLHILDKLMESEGTDRFLPFSDEILRERMQGDARGGVSQVGRSPDLFRAIRTYFNFEREGHFIVAMAVFNMFSLYFAQTQYTGSFLIFKPTRVWTHNLIQ